MKGRKFLSLVITATTAHRDLRNALLIIFVSQSEFRMIENGELLEYACMMIIKDSQGPSASSPGPDQDVVLRVDVQGAETIRKLCPEAV
jgi:guanylate kinase